MDGTPASRRADPRMHGVIQRVIRPPGAALQKTTRPVADFLGTRHECWMQTPSAFPKSGSSSSLWPETRWDRVLALRDPAAQAEALKEICEMYRPVLLALCRRWNEQEGEDLLQEFLLWVIESGRLELADSSRGRFRAYLSTLLGNFLRKHYRSGRAQKRGGGAEHVDWAEDAVTVEAAPDALFDRAWAQAVMGRVVMTLGKEAEASGVSADVLRSVLPALLSQGGDEVDESPWAEVAQRLGVSAGTLRSQASRLRARFRELLEREVSAFTAGSELEAEIRHLMRALMSDG